MIADWKLERYRLGELSATEAEAIRTALETDPALQARLQRLADDDAATLAAHPPRRVALAIHERATQPTAAARRPWLMPAVAFGLAAALLTVVGVGLSTRTDDGDIRLKGDGPSLRLFRLADPAPERLADGAKVKAHDVVQVAFDHAGAKHLAIISLDGAGHTTVHWPLDGNTATPLDFKALPESFELDAAPGFERFFLITSDQPLQLGELLSAVQAAGRSGQLAVPKAATQRSLLLEKVSP